MRRNVRLLYIKTIFEGLNSMRIKTFQILLMCKIEKHSHWRSWNQFKWFCLIHDLNDSLIIKTVSSSYLVDCLNTISHQTGTHSLCTGRRVSPKPRNTNLLIVDLFKMTGTMTTNNYMLQTC